MYSTADNGSSLACLRHCSGNQLSCGSENNRGIQFNAWVIFRATCPDRAKRPREVLSYRVGLARKGEYGSALMYGDLGDYMRRGTKSIYSNILGLSRHSQAAIPD